MAHIRVSKTIVFLALAVSLILPATAAARVGVGVGFYGGYWGGPFYPYYGWGPYYGYPYGYAPYGYGGRPMGEVKIKSPDSNAQIYINGSFVGRAHDLKRFYLKPGTYNFEQRIGTDVQKQRVYVLANRSLKIDFGKPGTPSPVPSPSPQPLPDPLPEPQK